MGSETDDRLQELELRLMHGERAHEVLNEVVVQQQGQIEALLRDVKRLKQALEGMKEAAPDDPPPHY
jgi:uncharacterized coiled-coil protein SlyX